MTITEHEFDQLKAQADRGLGKVPAEAEHPPDPGPESVLAGKIMKWCKQQGYVYQ